MAEGTFEFNSRYKKKDFDFQRLSWKPIAAVIILLILVFIGINSVKTIPVGHVGVATLFGKINKTSYKPGIYLVNPLFKWTLFDVRQKSHKESAQVPTQDQLQTSVDVSIQYNITASKAPEILEKTGSEEAAVNVHLVPKLRSLIREQGKSIKRAEDFFNETTQERLQGTLKVSLTEFLEEKGIEVTAVLIRDITLPPFITKAIEAKKEREQAVERQKAELERYRTEQQQFVAAAEASRKAAEEEAARQRVLADAQAYEIEKVTKAMAANPFYLQLQAIEALKSISKDPAAKVYFLDGNSPSPLPLMHIGEKEK